MHALQDVADRDTHDESHYKGFVKVERNIITFFEKSCASTTNYNPMSHTTKEEPTAISQRFLILRDGNVALLRHGSDSEILEETMGYGSQRVGLAIMKKR